MSNSNDDTELDRLREENRQLRNLLAEKEKTEENPFAFRQWVFEQTPQLAPTRTELEQQARVFHAILSSVADFIYVFDRQGRFLFVNQALLDLWQLTSDDVLGKTFFELPYLEELAARLQQQIDTVFQTGKSLKDETPYADATGATGYYEYIFVPVFGKEGQVEAVAGSTRDITSRQQEEAKKERLVKTLDVTRARLSNLFIQAPAFITVLTGPQHVFEIANPLYLQLVGHRDIIGKSVREALPELEGQGFFELLDSVYQTGTPFVGTEIRVLLQSEAGAPLQERYLDFIYQPLIEADGSVSGIFVHGVDLTERKQAEQALAEHAQEIAGLNARLRQAMTETHHRVKNNLQLISALIDLQRGENTDTVPMSEFARLSANVQALGVIHDVLTHQAKQDNPEETLSVKIVLDKLLSMLKSTLDYDFKLTYTIAEARLPGRMATSLALITNELFTNAIKHGNGQVDITFTVADDQARLQVCDDGAGFPPDFDSATSANTGLALIETLSIHDLSGRIEYGNHPEGGGRVIVTFPLKRL